MSFNENFSNIGSVFADLVEDLKKDKEKDKSTKVTQEPVGVHPVPQG